MIAQSPPCAPRVGRLFATLYGLAYTGLWMALLPPIVEGLAMRVRDIAPASAADSLSLVVVAGALVALVGNPLFGLLSDRTASRHGMRRPWLIGGALGGFLGLAVVALATSIPQLLFGWCVTQLAYNAQLAALAAIFSDQIPPSQRGKVSGVVNLTVPVGLIGGTYLVQAMPYSALLMLLVPAAVALIFALALAGLLHDRQLGGARLPRFDWRALLGCLWINPLRFPDFAWTWSSRFLLFAGVAALMTYQEFYLIQQLHCPPGEVPRLIFLATLVQSSMVAVFGLVAGGWTDAVGRRKVFVSVTALVYALALLMIAFAPSYAVFLVGMAVTGMAQGAYLAVDLALVNDVLPERESHAARNLGIFNMAIVLPQLLMPAIAPAILSASGGSYAWLFAIAAILAALGAWTILPVRGVR